MFKELHITNWKQFEKIDIEFHNNVTIFTGANGSGKTTLLNLLAKHFGWETQELATPKEEKETGFIKYFIGLFTKKEENNSFKIGNIVYNDNTINNLLIYEGDYAQYHISFQNFKQLVGLNIPSHRPMFFYEKIPHITTQKITKQQAFDQIKESKYRRLFSSGYSDTKTPNYYIKETLLNWAIGGSGNEFIQADPELRENFLDYEDILRKTLPINLGFEKISIRNYEIVFETKSGEFMLDAVSGGISAIIDLTWSIFNNVDSKNKSIVLIDEIENHLHATLQRTILPSLLEAFPNVQFIVSTHSPLIIGSVKDSNVYALRYNENSKVYNEKLDLINKAKSANEILNEVLGVPFSMPIWVERELEYVIEKYSEIEVSPDIFKKMRNELIEKGLESLMPWAMDKTLEKIDGKIK